MRDAVRATPKRLGADSVRMTTALDAPCAARRTSSSGSCSVPGQGRGEGELLGEGAAPGWLHGARSRAVFTAGLVL